MNGFDTWVDWLYSDGDIVFMAAKIIVFLFVLEAASFFVALISGITKAAK